MAAVRDGVARVAARREIQHVVEPHFCATETAVCEEEGCEVSLGSGCRYGRECGEEFERAGGCGDVAARYAIG